ncbi:MAG: hypothetical protein GX749_01335 [Ruminococcaceae bacterium]|nr:hypothetical protein [Oscillospiraceae bacterium]
MITLGPLHFVYIVMTILIIVVLLMKKEIVLPCVLGIFMMGLVYSGNLIKTIQIIYNSLVISATEFLGIIVVIALVVSMSKALACIGADAIMIQPLARVIKTRKVAFFVIGSVMLIASWFIWPSPAVALVGAILLPVAIKAGLPAIWAAVSMNLFGHGIGLSSDFFIQGAPSITAKAAGIPTTEVMQASIPLWLVMSVVTISVAFIMFLKDMKQTPALELAGGAVNGNGNGNGNGYPPDAGHTVPNTVPCDITCRRPGFARFIAVFTPLAFIVDVILMVMFKIVGGDATALVGGTAVLIMTIILIGKGDMQESLDQITDQFKDGFIFAIKIFAPVIVIAGFFFMGSGQMAEKMLGPGAPDILTDLGLYLSSIIPMTKIPIALVQTAIGVITGLDGSGFSGLPLLGSLAQTFSLASGANVKYIAALGQIVTVWVGGGTVIPWGVIPVAAICGVKASDLARKNLIPVMAGMAAMILVSFFLI